MNFIENAVYILFYPVIFLVLNNSQRTRVAIFHKNKILIVRPRLNLGKWIMPGGNIKKSETPEMSVIRETKEEIGIVLEPEKLIFSRREVNSYRFIKTEIHYYVYLTEKELNVIIDKNEIAEYKWVLIEDIEKTGIVPHEKTVIAKLLTP